MLFKSTKTVQVTTYFFGSYGPFDSAEEAFHAAVSGHIYYDGELADSFIQDKELLIALGDWAKENL